MITKVLEAVSGYVGGLGPIPDLGPALQVGLASTFSWALGARGERWTDQLQAAVEDLQARVGDLRTWEELAEDDAFVDAVIQASIVAQKTSKAEKLQALRNGVLHALVADALHVDEQARFFRLIDQLEPTHLRLLAILHNPRGELARIGYPDPPEHWQDPEFIVLEKFEAFAGKFDWYSSFVADLMGHQLVAATAGPVAIYGGVPPEPWTTPLGRRFLAFVTEPDV